ncbi:MAG: YdcF family protein [Gemmatimonadales bacterium]|nr:YdcF family protein [Gemmatimonadales bacterium]
MAFWSLRRVFKAAATAAVLLAAAWAAVVVAVEIHARRSEARSADAVVVLGAAQYNGRPSPVFRARLDHAAALYQRGLAPIILVTGGIGPGDTLNEANVGRDYLARRGLPADALVALEAGADTRASLGQVRSWFGARSSRRVLLVSDGFHMLRLRILARREGLVAFSSPATRSPIQRSSRRNLRYLLAEGYKVPITWLFQH